MSVDPNKICRCCGSVQSPENLFNLKSRCIKLPGDKTIDLEKWFLDFTNLNPLTYKSKYTKVCMPCETQLLKTYEFRSTLLLAELTFANESSISLLNSEPLRIEDADVSSPQSKLVNLDLPPGLKLEVRKAVVTPISGPQSESASWKRKPKVSCNKCGASFRTRKALAVHVKRHEQTYKCEEPNCGERFKAKSLLAFHLHHHKEMAKKLVCASCGKRYDSEELFVQHQQAHEDSTPIPCEDCDKTFILLQTMAHHQRTEHPKRQCGLCRRAFSAGRSLKLHMLQHAGIRFVCDACDNKEFDDHITLLQHLKDHPDGPLEFDEERHISIPDDIQKKMEIYEATEYPFACTTCKMKFKTKNELQEHKKTKWCENHREPVTPTTNNGVVVIFDGVDEENDYILEETIEEDL